MGGNQPIAQGPAPSGKLKHRQAYIGRIRAIVISFIDIYSVTVEPICPFAVRMIQKSRLARPSFSASLPGLAKRQNSIVVVCSFQHWADTTHGTD